MLQSGWTPGTALGASSISTPASEASAAKVKIAVKDNTLGLGASLKSKSIEHQRTGLDAFQGLLGRLNAKDAAQLKAVEERIENKKLVMFAQGRWGGMVFVPGGKLVQEDPTKQLRKPESDSADDEQIPLGAETQKKELDSTATSDAENEPAITTAKTKRVKEDESPQERALRKAEKKQRKQDRQARKEAKRLRKLQKKENTPGSGTQTPNLDLTETTTTTTTNTGTSTPMLLQDSQNGNAVVSVTTVTQQRLRNGRHVLRGRNIQAKRLAFADERGLDQIFMRQAQKIDV